MELSPELQSALKQIMVFHEGFENHPYLDTLGNISIGIGYNLTSRGLPDSWINQQYNEDVSYFFNRLSQDYDWFKDISPVRKMVLINMCFMGYRKFQGFKRMLACLSIQDFIGASNEIVNSRWAKQVKGRASTVSEMMKTDALPALVEM